MSAHSFSDGPWTLWVEDNQWFIFYNGKEWWRSRREDSKRFRQALNRRIGNSAFVKPVYDPPEITGM